MKDRKIIPLGTMTKWGKIGAVQYKNGERYYMMVKKGSISLMPASVVEAK